MKRRTPWLWVAAALGLGAAAGSLNETLRRARPAGAEFIETGEALEPHGAPPGVALVTVALGGFRGLLLDTLWLRAARLQDEGRYFELAQLAEWIARLDPRNAEIWTYHAWNLAYNISPLMPDPASRWTWLENGIRLLRDEGLAVNPDRPELYFELAWLFLDKLGGPTDPMAGYFRWRWARSVDAILPGGIADYGVLAADEPQRKRWQAEHRLDPFLMQKLEDLYGRLDWRVPQSHALYWASEGRRHAHGVRAMLLDRLIYQSMGQLFFRGRAHLPPDLNTVELLPRPDLLDRARATYERTLARYPEDEGVRHAYRHFLQQAVRLLHVLGREDQARSAYRKLRDAYGPEAAGDNLESFLARPDEEGGFP